MKKLLLAQLPEPVVPDNAAQFPHDIARLVATAAKRDSRFHRMGGAALARYWMACVRPGSRCGVER